MVGRVGYDPTTNWLKEGATVFSQAIGAAGYLASPIVGN